MQYGHAEAVADGVNVDFDVYRIRTRITEKGSKIVAGDTGVYVDVRHKLNRAERIEYLSLDLTYTTNQLDRDVVAESQIRTVLQQFMDKVLPDAYPARAEVPKTLIFAKDDSHADDIVRIAREVFAEGNEFCQKITYRTGYTRVTKTVPNEDGSESEVTDWVKTSSLTPDEILGNFRTSFHPRIAVTVDMIATGTDVKPIEIVFFMRNVKSAGFFEQMKGRGVRVISPDKLRVVTPSARSKDRFIIVDAVGVCENDKTECCTLNRQPSKPLAQLLEYVAQGGHRSGCAHDARRPSGAGAARVCARSTCRTTRIDRGQVGLRNRTGLAPSDQPGCPARGRRQPAGRDRRTDRGPAQASRRAIGAGRRNADHETRLSPSHLGNPHAERTDHRPPQHRRCAILGLRC
jgi:type I restriction enzyme R subunit